MAHRSPSSLPLSQWKAVVLHPPHPAADNAVLQLERLGLATVTVWPVLEPAHCDANVVLFDADLGHAGQFPWPAGHAPMPLIAMIGSEAPGRIEWTIAQGANGYLLKPLSSAGVFSALLIAAHAFHEKQRLALEVQALRERLAKRSSVVQATLILMAQGLDEAAATKRLRTMAMERRMTMEDLADDIAAQPARFGAAARRNKGE